MIYVHCYYNHQSVNSFRYSATAVPSLRGSLKIFFFRRLFTLPNGYRPGCSALSSQGTFRLRAAAFASRPKASRLRYWAQMSRMHRLWSKTLSPRARQHVVEFPWIPGHHEGVVSYYFLVHLKIMPLALNSSSIDLHTTDIWKLFWFDVGRSDVCMNGV